MNAIARRATAGLLALTLTVLPIMLLSTAAQAEEQRIQVGDLSQPAGVAAFDRGVERAAKEICGFYPLDAHHSSNVANCTAAVREEAMDQLNPHQLQELAAYERTDVQVAGTPSRKH